MDNMLATPAHIEANGPSWQVGSNLAALSSTIPRAAVSLCVADQCFARASNRLRRPRYSTTYTTAFGVLRRSRRVG